MKRLALLLVICLVLGTLSGAVAEDVEVYPVEEAPGEAFGLTGAPGLFAEGEEPAPESGDADDLFEVSAGLEDVEAETLPEDTGLPTEAVEEPAEEAEPAQEAAEVAEEIPDDGEEAGDEAEGAEQSEQSAQPHVDPNGPQLAANELTLGAGETFELNPLMPEGIQAGISCAVDDAAVATVTADGRVTAVAPGEARITATADDGTYAECFVHVKKAPDKIAFASRTFKLGRGELTDALKLLVGSVEGEFAGACEFTSSNEKIVRVDANGAIKGVKRGKATITARSYNGKTAKCRVTVVKAPKKVKAVASTKKLGVGETGTITYELPKGTASQGHFESDAPEIVAVDPVTGEMRGVGVGKAHITVSTFNKKKSRVTVKVGPAPQTLIFAAETFELGVGMTVKKPASLNSGALGAITYKVADKSVAQVVDGKLTGLAVGSTTLVAETYNGLKAECRVVVKKAPKKVKLPYRTLNLGMRQKVQLEPSVGASASSYTYKSADKKIARVNSKGVVTGLRRGSTVITVKTYNGKSFKLKVNVLKAPDSVSLSPDALELAVGEKAVLKAKLPKNTTGTVVFTVEDESIATVNAQTGEVTGVATGETVVTATTHNGKTAQAVVQVMGLPEWIEPEAGFIELSEGESEALSIEMSPGGRSPLAFESANPNIAVVSEDGVVTGVGGGSTIIRVTTDNPEAFCEVSVTVLPAPTSVSLDWTALTLSVGETMKLEPMIPEGSVTTFTFESSHSDVASISEDGTVVALAYGRTMLSVETHNGKRAELELTVLDPSYPEKVTLLNAPETMEARENLQLEWSVEPETADAELLWESSNPDVAEVDEDGVLHAYSFGYTLITAISERNGDIQLSFQLAVGSSDDVVVTIPARITGVDGISANLAKIDAIRACAIDQISALREGGVISESDASKRKSMVNNAFKDYAFPWMTPSLQKYWKAANSEGGVKDFKPGRVYYGMPYISGSGGNRQYNVAKALSERRYTDSGKGYYLLNQDNLLKGLYCGNDCSCFVDAAIWGTGSSHSADRTAEIAQSSAYRTVKELRTGDLICKGYAHVVMFLYYVDAAKTKIMIIENGGSEPGTNTVHCIVMDVDYYISGGYSARRLASLDR